MIKHEEGGIHGNLWAAPPDIFTLKHSVKYAVLSDQWYYLTLSKRVREVWKKQSTKTASKQQSYGKRHFGKKCK